MNDLPNFPLLFARIAHYLSQPSAPGQEGGRKAAVEAYNELTNCIYFEEPVARCSDHPVIQNVKG